MARTATERAMNISGHAYSYWEPGRVHICQICGTAEHKNGEYWWAGRWSLVEPPCGHTRGQFGDRKLLYVKPVFEQP